MGPELDSFDESEESELARRTLEGVGVFDLELGQLTSTEFTGELEFKADVSVEESGSTIEGQMSAVGEVTFTTTIEVSE